MVILEFLGTGNAFLPQGRFHSLLLIDDSILIDCPPTALASLRRINISPRDINSILFTHWHGDHYFGFPFLILERKWISDREGEMELGIHGPSGCKKRLVELCELAYPGSLGDRLDSFKWNEEERGRVHCSPQWSYERFEVEHEIEVDPHGYIMNHESGLKLMHTGDSGPCEAISSRAGDCDVVVMEMGVPDEVVIPQHFRPSTVATLANANPETIFLVTHTWLDDPDCEREPIISNQLPPLPDNVIQVSDGERFSLNSEGLQRINE
jgi:ribonuclease BN (tRNA processing enzyme)